MTDNFNMPLWADFLDDFGNYDDGEDFDPPPQPPRSWEQIAVDEIIAEEEAEDDYDHPF